MAQLDEHERLSSAVRSIPPKEIGNRGFFPSKKIKNGIVEYESQIERDFFLLLDHSDDVELFQHQPIKIPFVNITGKKKTYVPDVYVRFSNGIEIIVEIKDEETFEKDKSKFQERWDACIYWTEERNMSFIVLTDMDIRSTRLMNIWFTLGSSKQIDNDKWVQKISRIIPEEGLDYNSYCYQIAEELGVNINKASQILSYAIYHGYLLVDTFSEKILSKSTIIRKRNRNNSPFRPLWIELDEALQQRDVDKIFEIKYNSVKEISSTVIDETNVTLSRKEFIVQEFLKTPSFKRDLKWRAKFEAKHEVAMSTVYNWINRYEEEGKSGLQNKYYRSGRKKKWNENTLNLFEIGRKESLKPNYPIKKAYEEIILNKWNKDEDPPSYSSFWRYIQENTTYYEKEVTKKGRKRKRELQPSIKSFQGAIMPMQVLQFDNTPFDLFIQDEETKQSVGTPNLCAAIDVYTRMITGFELSLSPINRQSVLETLVQSIVPKERYMNNIFSDEEYQPAWEIKGFPVVMLVDNGMDYRSEDVQRFCMEYDIILEFAPVRNPRYKAYIENWFKILKEAVALELAEDGFRPSLRKRVQNPDFDPEANVIFTYQQSELWLASWILDEYHITNSYRDGLLAPILRLEDYERGSGTIVLPQPREPPKTKSGLTHLQVNALMTTERTLTDKIEFANLHYSSTDLINLFHKKGKLRVKILYDMRDIRVIWLIDLNTNKPIELDLTVGWASSFIEFYGYAPISLSFWKKEVELIRARNRKRLSVSLFRKEKGKEFRSRMRNKARKKRITKRKRREKEIHKENITKIERKSRTSISPTRIRNLETEYEKSSTSKVKNVRVKTIRIPTEDTNPFIGNKRNKRGK